MSCKARFLNLAVLASVVCVLGQAGAIGAVCPSPSTLQGVDVSSLNGAVDWNQVQASGRAFAFVRLSDGLYIDPQFATNYAAIKAAGMIRGAYQFFEPGQDPTAQANLAIQTTGTPGIGDLPLILDVEITANLSPAMLTSAIQTWISTVQAAAGRIPIIMTGPGFWAGNVGSSSFGGNPLAVMNWGVTCPNLPSGWRTFSFWQYTDTGSVPGIIGAADLDLFNGSIADLRSLAGYPRYQPAGTMCDGEPGHQILAPIDSGGGSVFKQGRTVPARFRVCDFSGQSVGTTGVVSSFALTDILMGTVNTAVDESVLSSTPDSVFRWDDTDQQWIFNINTSGLLAGSTYVFAINLNDGTTITFQLGLR